MTGGVHLAAGGERGGWVPFRDWLGGLRAETRAGPDRFPEGPVLFFYFLFLFSFSVFFICSHPFQI
jgi:hypothetical protein